MTPTNPPSPWKRYEKFSCVLIDRAVLFPAWVARLLQDLLPTASFGVLLVLGAGWLHVNVPALTVFVFPAVAAALLFIFRAVYKKYVLGEEVPDGP